MKGILGAFGALFLNRAGRGDDVEDREDGEGIDPKCTILVIDDDPALLDSLRPLLREAKFTVLTALSGAKGLDLLRYAQKDIRVVLLDYNMPRLSGLETLTYVRKISPNAKVVALTGIAPELLPEEYRTNVDRYMPKPFRTSELVKVIHDLAGLALPEAVPQS